MLTLLALMLAGGVQGEFAPDYLVSPDYLFRKTSPMRFELTTFTLAT